MSVESPRLRLLAIPAADEPPTEHDARAEVKAIRRSIARFLRALHASGQGITAWPEGIVSQLAHADAVTARFLAEPGRVDPERAHEAADQLRAIEKWITAKLGSSDRARLRRYELAIRVEESELDQPLVQPDRAPEDDAPALPDDAARSLRAGLGRLSNDALAHVARRLGLRTGPRVELELHIARVLRDDALLRILVATLSRESLELLAALIRGIGDARTIAQLAEPVARPMAVAVNDAPHPPTPVASLRECALVFSGVRGDDEGTLWVPVELRHRIHGLLRALGV